MLFTLSGAPEQSIPMTTITMTTKGRVTLPAPTRAKLRLVAGTQLTVTENERGEIVLQPKTGDIADTIIHVVGKSKD